MTAKIREFLLRLSILRSSSTSLRDSPWVSTFPQIAPIVSRAASQGSPRAAQRWTAAAAARTDALVRACAPRRVGCLPVCWSAGAAQTRTVFTSGVVARAIGPEASGDRPSARACTVVGKLCGSARWPKARCEASCAAPRTRDCGRGRPSCCPQLVSRVGGCPRRVRPTPAPKQRPHCEAGAAHQCSRRQRDSGRQHNRPWAGSSARP